MEFVPDKFVLSSRMIDDALRFMRVPPAGTGASCPSTARDALVSSVRDTFAKLESYIRPRSVWGRFPISCLDGLDIGNSLRNLLSESRECYLMAVTIGHEADRQIALAQKRDMLEGVMMDACASVRADALCCEVEAAIVSELKDGEHITARFSPGYGDAPLSLSEDIISLLNATRRIGLSMTRSLMMTPVKSVTAIIGVTDVVSESSESRENERCESCGMGDVCPYKYKNGEICRRAEGL